jgi:hypothetical protein
LKEGIFLRPALLRSNLFRTISLIMGILLCPWLTVQSSANNLNADGHTNQMPIGWNAAFVTVIDKPDMDRLGAGEILTEIKRIDSQTVVAQSIGRIKARPQDCYQLVRQYDRYTELMPHTVESKVIRTFSLEDQHPGAEAMDFWTRIRVFGFSTRYLMRIAHLIEPDAKRLDIYWTLVDTPERMPGCLDAQNEPCRNDLAVNLGSHRFEPFPGQADHTLHTYTITLAGTRWYQHAALRIGAKQSMADVVLSIRNALKCAE